MNTYQILKLNDGTEVKLTLTFGLLYKLKVTDEKLYDEILIASGNDTLLASDLYKYNRYFSLMKSLNKQLKALGGEEIVITK